MQYPGRYEEVFAIGAIDQDENIASYSVPGAQVAFVAPGSDVESLMPDNQYGISSGTSWATAYVSGAIALLISVNPSMPISAIKELLIMSSNDLGGSGFDEVYGNGLIDAEKLLSH